MTGRQIRTRQKYKDSCTHCAGAKVKCSKEKPLCARCSERGLACSYGLSHRYGRLPAATKLRNMVSDENRSSTTPSSPRALLPSQSAASSPSTDPGDLQYSWLNDVNTGLSLGTGSPTVFNGCVDFGYDSSIPQPLMQPHFNGIAASVTSWSTQELQASTPPTSDLSLAVGSSIGTMNFTHCLDSGPRSDSGGSHSRSVSSVASLSPGFEYQAAGFSHTPPTAFCTPPETPCHAFPSNTSAVFSTQHDCLSLASTILMALKNGLVSTEVASRETIDQTLQMIECDCFTTDDHTRLFMVLIGLEIMARFSRMTQEFGAIESTEVILEDLQVVVKFIERLLRRLRRFTASSKSAGPSLANMSNKADIISTAVFRQLEEDLRTNLRGISNTTMDVLRRV
ncbi:hypothetical protein F5X99DRAFT_300304 [Biscogniauxia marginata]|nr:hypothetical protein F5X99DRAFT_300304 [Biscogniauxia marginata]